MSDQCDTKKNGQVHFTWRLVVIVVLLNALAWGIVAWTLHQAYRNHRQRAESEAQNFAKLLEHNVADGIDKINLTLNVVTDEISRQQQAGGMDEQALRHFIARLHSRIPDAGSIRVIDGRGIVVQGSGTTLAERVDVSDREYFKSLRDQKRGDIYVSGPMIGRSSQEWIMIFSRRIDRPDGSFGGVVNVSLPLEQVRWMFSTIGVGQRGIIALRNQELGIIVRHPGGSDDTPVSSHQTLPPPWRTFLDEKLKHGVFSARSAEDGGERITAVQRVGDYPLYLSVELAVDDFVGNWWHALYASLVSLLIFFLVTAWMSVQLSFSWRKQMALIEQLDDNQRIFRSLAAMSADWFWEQDAHFRFVDVSGDLVRKYGISPEGINGKTRWELGGETSEDVWLMHRSLLEAHEAFHEFEYCFIDETGKRRCISVSGEPIFDTDGNFSGYRGVGRDLTEKREYEERIERMAQFDGLTGLPNRALTYDRLLQIISMAKRERREFALLYFDLDKFKPVNDRHGHNAGDQLLQMVASRMRFLLRESDTVGRIGGDEFVVLLPAISSHDDAEEVAQKIIAALTSPYTLDGVPTPVDIGVSIGIAIYPRDGDSSDALIRAADVAMYQAKRTGNRCCFVDASASLSGALPEHTVE